MGTPYTDEICCVRGKNVDTRAARGYFGGLIMYIGLPHDISILASRWKPVRHYETSDQPLPKPILQTLSSCMRKCTGSRVLTVFFAQTIVRARIRREDGIRRRTEHGSTGERDDPFGKLASVSIDLGLKGCPACRVGVVQSKLPLETVRKQPGKASRAGSIPTSGAASSSSIQISWSCTCFSLTPILPLHNNTGVCLELSLSACCILAP
jgi:hypothetical protein